MKRIILYILGINLGIMGFGCSKNKENGNQEEIDTDTEVVYPYVYLAQNYLKEDASKKNVIYEYLCNINDGVQAGIVNWNKKKDATTYDFVYRRDGESYLDAKTITSFINKVELYNLYKGSKYLYDIFANTSSGQIIIESGSFTTTDLGPRVMKIDGLYNVRDLGGYKTIDGKMVNQGLIYRGCELNGSHDIDITEEGKKTFKEELGIKTELDFRGSDECLNITESPAGKEVNYIRYPINPYISLFDTNDASLYCKVFQVFADEDNYPIYFHCWGGADRTGCVAWIINALL